MESGWEDADAEVLQKVKQEFCPIVKDKLMLVLLPANYLLSPCLALTSCVRMPVVMRLSTSLLRNATKVLAVILSGILPPRHGTIKRFLALGKTMRPSSQN